MHWKSDGGGGMKLVACGKVVACVTAQGPRHVAEVWLPRAHLLSVFAHGTDARRFAERELWSEAGEVVPRPFTGRSQPARQNRIGCAGARRAPRVIEQEASMRALFVGGTVDNSELDLDRGDAPVHYPSETGSGLPRYRLYEIGQRGGEAVYAVYAAPNLASDVVDRVISERDYARRFAIESRRSPDQA